MGLQRPFELWLTLACILGKQNNGPAIRNTKKVAGHSKEKTN